MNWVEQCGVVIPCLNEAATIGALVTEVRRHLPTVLVVDDGSNDSTAELAARAGAIVLRNSMPRGKGAALATGFRWLREKGYGWALTMDGDGQHEPGDIPGMLRSAECSGASLIVGNRMADARLMPWLRRQVNCWMSDRLSRIAGQSLPDSQCGFRLLQLSVWASLDLRCEHFEVESEMLLAFIAAGQRAEFVPISVIYRGEQSKINPLLDSWRWLRCWWRLRVDNAPRRQVHPVPVAARPIPN